MDETLEIGAGSQPVGAGQIGLPMNELAEAASGTAQGEDGLQT